jgi:biopolymer transport protein ExbD
MKTSNEPNRFHDPRVASIDSPSANVSSHLQQQGSAVWWAVSLSLHAVTISALVYLLVTASFRKPPPAPKPLQHREIHINLPNAAHSKSADTKTSDFVIAVDREGKIFLGNDALFSDQELTKRLQHIALTAPDTRVLIDADREASVSHVIKVMDLCQLWNLTNIGFRTRSY